MLNAHVVEEPIAGDFDWDYMVDDADLEFWREKYGQTPEADADLDADTDGNDFLIWQRHFGVTTSPSPSASLPSTPTGVPEPAAWRLAAIVIVARCCRRGWL